MNAITQSQIRIRMLAAAAAMLLAAGGAAAGERPADWESPEAIVAALYATVSADAGAQRDWDRFRALFFDQARLMVAMDSTIASGIMASTVEELIQQTQTAYAASGFHEVPLITKVERHGQMASVHSSFEVKLRSSDPQPLMRGLNHFQLLNDGERWWIVSNIGVMETKDMPLPAAYLPAN